MITTVYVAGPMTGLPHNNYPMFQYVTRRLRQAGLTVISPAELEHNQLLRDRRQEMEAELGRRLTRGELYKLVMPGDIEAVAKCDALVMLPGYEESKGTGFEMHAADLFEIEIITPDDESGTMSLEEWVDRCISIIKEENDSELERITL